MDVEARIKFFQVEKCGYYHYGSPTPAFGDLGDMLDDLATWVSGKSLSETATYEPTDEQDSNLLRTFCYGVSAARNGDVLLTTWNETPTTEGAVASVQLSGQVNSAAVATAAVRTGYVTGYPAYFWFPNGTNLYATIQVRNRLNGRSNLNAFLRGFLEKYSKYTVLDAAASSADEDVIAGYAADGTADNIESVRPSYRCGSMRIPGDIEFLRANRALIRHIERRDVLHFDVREDIALWQKLWRSVTGNQNATLTGQHRVRLDLEYEPSEEDFESVVAHWNQEHEAVGNVARFQDVGFRLQGHSRVYWLSRSVASDTFELDVTYSNDAVIDAGSLLRQLNANRQEILTLTEGRQNEVA